MAKFGCLASAMAAMLATSVASAQEVTVSGGAVAGKIISASVEVGSNATATVMTVPENGFFVLTLICSGPNISEVPFHGSIFGFIAQSPPGQGAGGCQEFLPGVALNPGEDITCINTFSLPTNCQVSGVLSRR
jgi:hypothetical protein